MKVEIAYGFAHFIGTETEVGAVVAALTGKLPPKHWTGWRLPHPLVGEARWESGEELRLAVMIPTDKHPTELPR